MKKLLNKFSGSCFKNLILNLTETQKTTTRHASFRSTLKRRLTKQQSLQPQCGSTYKDLQLWHWSSTLMITKSKFVPSPIFHFFTWLCLNIKKMSKQAPWARLISTCWWKLITLAYLKHSQKLWKWPSCQLRPICSIICSLPKMGNNQTPSSESNNYSKTKLCRKLTKHTVNLKNFTKKRSNRRLWKLFFKKAWNKVLCLFTAKTQMNTKMFKRASKTMT